jgi:hypothetical protein
VLLSARRVGPSGKAFGLDMTDEMLELARDNARKAGATNVEFLKGYIEDPCLKNGGVDVVISNCVINLSTDKSKVVREMFRVLRSGGRLSMRRRCGGQAEAIGTCGAGLVRRLHRGSLSFSEYREELTTARFEQVERRTHPSGNGSDVRGHHPGGQAVNEPSLARRSAAEFVGTAFLTLGMIGSGIAASSLSHGEKGFTLVLNALATGLVLTAIILGIGSVSGGQLNPAVTLVAWATGGLSRSEAGAYALAQLVGAVLGAAVANVIFGLAAFDLSAHARSSWELWTSEVVATFGWFW